jgi:Protein of unknown function (DUF2924)
LDRALKLEIEDLRRMTVGQLRRKHLEVFGEETRSNHKEFLFKRIAWRMQAVAEGGLSDRARRRAMDLANDADLRIRAPKNTLDSHPTGCHGHATSVDPAADPRLPMMGEIISRDYKGRRISVEVRANGFDYDGKLYRSLSSIARQVTGTQWNGFAFFGLVPTKETTGAKR